MFRETEIRADYIKAGRLTDERVNVKTMRPLILAFIGFNSHLTRLFFKQFARDNLEQIFDYDFDRGLIELYDGTKIMRMDSGKLRNMDGVRIDQIIVADDQRGYALICHIDDLRILDCHSGCSQVPEEFRILYYNVDAPMLEE